jgi:hypothetical protein
MAWQLYLVSSLMAITIERLALSQIINMQTQNAWSANQFFRDVTPCRMVTTFERLCTHLKGLRVYKMKAIKYLETLATTLYTSLHGVTYPEDLKREVTLLWGCKTSHSERNTVISPHLQHVDRAKFSVDFREYPIKKANMFSPNIKH